MPIWATWLLCAGFLVWRALLAAAESALYGTSEMRAKELAAQSPRAGGRVLRHKVDRETTAASFRIGMVLAGMLAVAVAVAALAIHPVLGFELSLSELRPEEYWKPLLVAFGTALAASLLEVTFRTVASASPERWAMRLSVLVSMLVFTIYPLMRLLVFLLNLIVRPFGGKVRFESPPPPLEELEKLLTAQAMNQEVDKSAPALIRSIFELSDKRCRDVMVPRTDVIAVEVSTPPADILQLLAEETHSRLPVYKDDQDHIVGVLHARDLIPLLQHPELIVLPDVIRPAHFVPWVKPIGDLLRDMQKRRIHMAMVVDEYGGFMGVVTLEDILREIVGDIPDEFDDEEKQVDKQADGSFLLTASMPVEDFQKAFSVKLPDGEYDTLGGFLASLAGALPEVGERFAHQGYQFVIHSKEGARIQKVRVLKPQKSVATGPVRA